MGRSYQSNSFIDQLNSHDNNDGIKSSSILAVGHEIPLVMENGSFRITMPIANAIALASTLLLSIQTL